MNARDIMTTHIVSIRSDATVDTVAGRASFGAVGRARESSKT